MGVFYYVDYRRHIVYGLNLHVMGRRVDATDPSLHGNGVLGIFLYFLNDIILFFPQQSKKSNKNKKCKYAEHGVIYFSSTPHSEMQGETWASA